MAVITDSGNRGVVDTLCIHTDGQSDISSVARESVKISFEGIEGDSHNGLTRASCVRVKRQYKVGTTIRNTRQISIVSTEELAKIADRMEIPVIQPQWLGANVCLSGIPDLTNIPPASRLLFESGASLVVDVENEPCDYPARIIEKQHPGVGKYFVKHAMRLRGITAWVECEGIIERGGAVEVHTPPSRQWLGK